MVRIVQDNKLYLAPIDKTVKRILDVGTGTGIWAMEIVFLLLPRKREMLIKQGDEFPSAEVIGTDLSPTQPNW